MHEQELMNGIPCDDRWIMHSPWIGDVEWDPKCELFFPRGLPGFEDERRMIPVEIPAQRPLVYLQSLEEPDVCFVCMPILVIDPAFQLTLSDDERSTLAIAAGRAPVLGRDVLCLGLLVPCRDTGYDTVEVNLAAPIVISLINSCCLQPVDDPARCFRLEPDGKWAARC
jgi:flagellar assembly factor FliW